MTTRRYLMCFAVAQDEDFSFMNTTTTIEGDLEQGIAKVKQRIVNDFAKDGISISIPVLLSAIPLENIRPPSYVELPTTVRQSMEQIVIDYIKGKSASVADVNLMDEWLNAIKGAE